MLATGLRCISFLAACTLVTAAGDIELEIVLAPHGGDAAEDREIRLWQERAREPQATPEIFDRLGWAYVSKARRTLDAGFYLLAGKTAEVAHSRFGPVTGSRLLRGHVLHNLHRFREAETVARQLVDERGSPADLALLSDALIEQGKLSEGMVILQRMLDLKPGTESFARAAHVRWLKGDPAGASAMMESALQASDARDAETRAWLLTRLSALYLQRGDAAGALQLADAAHRHADHYPPALLARGRALISLNRTVDALVPLREAAGLQPLPEYQWWLADTLAAAGQREEAAAVERELKKLGAVGDARTFALFLATRGEGLKEAQRLARAELAERGDVFTRDALAWVLAANGEFEAAAGQMRLALSEGTKDARLFLHAGEIALARGERDRATKFFEAADAASATLTPSERARLARRISRTADLVFR
jgi:tetratricopeptide (TPR) repeat protein